MSLFPHGPSLKRPRIHVLDFIRLVAMLLMIQGHTLDAFMDPSRIEWDSVHWNLWVHLRGLTAPLFLMISGAVTVLGIRHEPDGRISHALLRRRISMAFLVIGIGYLMVFPASRILDLPWIAKDVWQRFLQVNILQLNGVTLLMLTTLLALARTVRRYAAWSLAAGATILVASPFATSVDWFRWLPESLAAYLSFAHGSLFPLFPASAYMFLGVGFGALLLETPEERRVRTFRLACMTASAGLMLLSLAVSHLFPLDLFPPHDPYKSGLAYSLLRVAFALLVFAALAWVAEQRPRWAEICAPMGRKSLYVYVVHLVVIYGTPWTAGFAATRFHALSVGESAAFIPVVGALTFGGIILWDWIHTRSASVGNLLHASAAFALFYALVF